MDEKTFKAITKKLAVAILKQMDKLDRKQVYFERTFGTFRVSPPSRPSAIANPNRQS